MIRIHKPELAPAILLDRGVTQTSELCRIVEAGEAPSFDSKIYGHFDVKQALRIAQHDKCCFCESKLSHAQFGDVEHFRPKKVARQAADAPTIGGYYWLAYSWDNLYLSCEVCNRRHKHELFPLLNPDNRVSGHHRAADLHLEQPVFIDPGREEPTRFIEFRREYAAPVGRSERGTATIASLALNRPPLAELRRDSRKLLISAIRLLAIWIQNATAEDEAAVVDLLEDLIDRSTATGQYSSMVRALLRQVAPWLDEWTQPAAALLAALRTDSAAGRLLRIDGL